MLRRGLLCLVLVAFATSGWAQATFNARNNGARTWTPAAPTSTALAHTMAVGSNGLLIVAVHMNLDIPVGASVSNVTYGGQPLTELTSISDANPETRTEVWYMLTPPTGANNVLVTVGGMNAGETVRGVVSATSYTNADQTAPTSATNFGDSTAATVTIAATSTTDTILDFVTARQSTTLADGAAPQTEQYDVTSGGTTNNDVAAGSSDRAAATPNTTMNWTLGTSRRWSQVAVNIKAATADVEINKYATSDPVIPGGILTYTMQIQNNGPSTATGVTLSDPIPGTTTFVGSSTSQGSCSGTTTVTCNIGTLAVGGTATVTIQVQAPLTGGFIGNNTATVSSTTSDPGTPNTSTVNAYSLVQATVCGTQPGKDGAGGTLAGIVNSYWPGTTTAAAVGATTLNVGARRGAAVSITAGDLVLIIQMQDAAINNSNDDRYGDGAGITGGTSGIGAGSTNLNSTGRYEYVIATNTVNAAGGAFNFTAVGGGNGLVYSYNNAAATATLGQRRYQIVRIPQYTTATMGATVTAASWNGTTGGILGFDVAGDLALGSVTANVNGLGFRGGAGLAQAGGAGANTDYRTPIASTTNGSKGEGIAGTPEWVLDAGANLDTGPAGYPNGDFARGAPGNAGGGGTDGNPAANDQNSGGGGGANWGRGGRGGNSWQSNLNRGGFGGAPYYDSPGKVILGGGGGAGSRNNSATIAGAGGAGGGIVLIRAGRLTGTGTITANGAAAYNLTDNDGGGGGGAGGSIVILARGGGLANLTLQATGGRGGDAWATEPPNGSPGERHGPGGGGGGGYIATNGTINGASTVAGATSGVTTTSSDTFGAQVGAPGNIVTSASFDEITGVKSGCTDLSVSITDTPDPVIAGNAITYTIAVTNNSTTVPAQNPTITLTTAPGTTFGSITPPAGWTCGTQPAPGGTGTIICTATNPLAPSTGSGNFTMVLNTNPSLANGATVTQSVTTATTSPETNTANNTATATTAVIRRVDVAATKVTNSPGPDNAFQQGETLIYTITVTNNGPSVATNVVMSDPLPAGFSFVSVVPGGPTCTQSLGTVTCTYATMNPGATNNITITGTITVNTAQLTNTASTTRTETDTVPANNNATAIAWVLAPTAVRMFETNLEQDLDGNVRIAWNTSFEVDNLGFNVYRETSKGRIKVNEHLIPGSALFSARRRLESGSSYAWKDKVANGEFAQYTIEDLDLNGIRTLHGPFTPVLTSNASVTSDLRFSSEARVAIATEDAGGGIFVSPRGLGAPKYPTLLGSKKERDTQFELSNKPAVKLMVTQEGWYRVTKAQLAETGVAYKGSMSLFTGGVEQPILVTDDAIEFYGVGLDTPGTGARTYWLSNSRGTNLRILKSTNRAGLSSSVARTPYTFERIERTVFFTALTTNGDGENFFGAIVTTAPVTQDLAVENIDRAGGNASLEVVLQGGSESPHAVQLSMNNVFLGTVNVSGMQRKTAKVAVPNNALNDGANTLTLTALNGDLDVSVVEALRLTYPHRLVADDNALKISVAGSSTVKVSGFTSTGVRAFDVTDPLLPSELLVDYVSGTATFLAPPKGTRSIVVVGNTRVLAPSQLIVTRGSSWNNAKKTSADLLILTNAALASAAEPLKARRDGEGVLTTIVDVQDLYDEFNFGDHGPAAIREFLSRTREWKRAPKYILLLGDASLDPRNYLGLGSYDLVPTKLVPTSMMKTASDDWLVDFANTGIPQLAIGRLPARTVADAQVMINRIAQRNTTGNDQVSFVSGQDPDFDFPAAAQELGTLVPGSLTKTFGTSATNASFESLLMTYVGHGSVELWSAGFSGTAASQLANTKRPIIAAMTCLNGYYHDVYTTSLAEALLLNPNGGAVAVWASSTLTVPFAQIDMAEELYRRLFAGSTLGEAAARSKAATDSEDVRRSWILFGDPSMKLR